MNLSWGLSCYNPLLQHPLDSINLPASGFCETCNVKRGGGGRGGISLLPNPQPRGPGGQALFTLMFNLFGFGDPTKVQDSCEHSSTCRGYGGAQTVPPLYVGNSIKAVYT